MLAQLQQVNNTDTNATKSFINEEAKSEIKEDTKSQIKEDTKSKIEDDAKSSNKIADSTHCHMSDFETLLPITCRVLINFKRLERWVGHKLETNTLLTTDHFIARPLSGYPSCS